MGRAETHPQKVAFLFFSFIKSNQLLFLFLRKPKNAAQLCLLFPARVPGSRRLQGTSSRLLRVVAPTAQASATYSTSINHAGGAASDREPSTIGPAQSL